MSVSKNTCWAKVILDSVSPGGRRITSVEVRYWRMIHSEIMTHRDRARNAASSRAIPFYRERDGAVVCNCTYGRIETDPFMPEFCGTEQKGMQSGGELAEPNRTECLQIVDEMRRNNLAACKRLHDLGLHKSLVNRYVEPWSYITVLMTATRWKNFFRLRVHPKAEKHFQKVARQMQDAVNASTPRQLVVGEWHMPYLRPEDGHSLRDERLRRVSAARCARLSYLTHDGVRDQSDDLRLFSTLIDPRNEDGSEDDAIHASALEHVARAEADPNHRSGPFTGWHQLRKDYPREDIDG